MHIYTKHAYSTLYHTHKHTHHIECLLAGVDYVLEMHAHAAVLEVGEVGGLVNQLTHLRVCVCVCVCEYMINYHPFSTHTAYATLHYTTLYLLESDLGCSFSEHKEHGVDDV
jgi:hypothetical protein